MNNIVHDLGWWWRGGGGVGGWGGGVGAESPLDPHLDLPKTSATDPVDQTAACPALGS